MKAQKSVFGKIVEVDNQLMFQDSAGVNFLIEELNEKGTSLYKRARAAANNPAKYGWKVRVVGTLKAGSIGHTRVPAEKVNENIEPVGNFNKPNGGLVAMKYETNVPPAPASAEMTEDVLQFIHNDATGLKPKMLFMNPR